LNNDSDEDEKGEYNDDADFEEKRPRKNKMLQVKAGGSDGGKDDDSREDDYMEYDEDEKPVHGFSG
jgi:hypothetical protein